MLLRRTLRAAALLLLVAAPAQAQRRTKDTKEREARELFEKGQTLFNLAEYDAALESFKAGYTIDDEPEFLFNIGQCHRMKGDCAQALRLYKNYLRERPNAPNRAMVQNLISEMETCAPRKKNAAGQNQLFAPAGGGLEAAAAPARPINHVPGLAAAVVGGVILAATGYLAVQSASAAGEISRVFRTGGSWEPQYHAIEDMGRNQAGMAVGLGIAGAAVFAAGGAWYWFNRPRQAPAVSVTPAPDGARIAWSTDF